MSAVWLGEDTIPKLIALSDGWIRFSHSESRRLWPGILIVVGFGVPCVALCTFLAIYAESPVNPVFLRTFLFGFCVAIVGAISCACWCVDVTLFNTQTRTVARDYYFMGKKFWRRKFQIRDEDYVAVVAGDDEYGTGGFHRIYIFRGRPVFLFSVIHLPSTKPSEELIHTVDEIAGRLRIENRGYIGWNGVWRAWTRCLARKD